MNRETWEENKQATERLQKLVAGLDDRRARQQMPGGWTVSALLAHMAFWDYRALVLLERWKGAGVSNIPLDPDSINDAAQPLCLVIAPEAAKKLVIEAAIAIDRALEKCSPELIAEIESKPGSLRLSRAHHRNEHLDEIESLA